MVKQQLAQSQSRFSGSVWLVGDTEELSTAQSGQRKPSRAGSQSVSPIDRSISLWVAKW
ncbi:hypothetical protein H7J71_01000 [Mycolicibacterium peregrinum]|uniref:hypothetical protein n=1 Tax=Mycolicibacterium peregrinum TaxID=43304 RepID=UPI0013747D2D|nr:hypothetical protein [Mycolicibacterium peregrinum]MCV7200589.1 hypothetical protein [Mycolicibacterium peregrinum]